MTKMFTKAIFTGVLCVILTAAYRVLGMEGTGAAVFFMQDPKDENGQQTAYTSIDYRYKKEFERTLNKYLEFAQVYEESCSTAVPGLISTEILGSACDQMVPQGICIAGDYMLITAYDNTGKFFKAGKTDGYEVNPSVLYVMSNENPEDRRLLTTIVLPDVNHVGGVAFDGKRVWIAKSTSRECSVIDYRVIEDAVNSGVSSYQLPDYDQNIYCGAVASFVTYHDGKLWVGTYANRISQSGMLRCYEIAEKKEETGVRLTLHMQNEIQIPAFANGVAFQEEDGKTYMAITSSRGRYFSSHIYFYQVAEDKNTGRNLFYCYDSRRFPPMAEELVCDGEWTYFLFESSATCYSVPTYQSCAYPVDRICAMSTAQLFTKKGSPLYKEAIAARTVPHPAYFPCDMESVLEMRKRFLKTVEKNWCV